MAAVSELYPISPVDGIERNAAAQLNNWRNVSAQTCAGARLPANGSGDLHDVPIGQWAEFIGGLRDLVVHNESISFRLSIRH
jgi:hypothetical protein